MKRPVALLTSLLFSGLTMAELSPMNDDAMAEVKGSGLGIVLEDYSFHAGSEVDPTNTEALFQITGIKTSDGRDVTIKADNFFIGGKGSAEFVENGDGTTSFIVNPTTVNIGRLNNPLEISQRDGDDLDIRAPNKGVLEIAQPDLVAIEGDPVWIGTKMDPCLKAGAAECAKFSSREAVDGGFRGERIDYGLEIDAEFEGTPDSDTSLTYYVKEAVFDGSYIRLWGDETATGSESADDQRNLTLANIRLNMYTPDVFIASCGNDGNKCGDAVHIKHLAMDLIIGVGEIQPAMLSVTSDGNFQLEVEALPAPTSAGQPTRISTVLNDQPDSSDWAATEKDFYDNYYNDTIPGIKTKSSLYIGDPTISNPTFETAGGLKVGDTYLGTSKLEGLQIQYLKFTTHDIGG
ncbi:hypothetical protein [Litoribrevibacter albus]|uniref:Uncharacterized protein n=1 Tax=Litoribrevibacter albus TaxID=1473156 RepID=A0AA37SAU3_9GAMM|nr:hypothetical protein [Litoribrevibacter albus]GLQ32445.1 hypothetical protein GCM10007876_29240 [Litoribrevibacter albus]